jgi:hypothetical protein
MVVLRNSSIALLFLTLGVAGFAQEPEKAQDTPTPGVVARRVRAGNGTPCWKQAGMTPDMVNQRWHLEDQQKAKIAQVCTESSSSPQQKHEKIDQIHADTDHAMAQLIPTKELAAFNKCQAELDQRRPKAAGQKELGPCGGMIPASAPADETTAPEHRHSKTPTNQ